jgi:WS/DGAT/MGAT family acyltransferase
MEKLSVVDSIFVTFESEDSPMHVAGLLVFELPERSKATFCRNLYNRMRKYNEASYPFNQKVVMHNSRLPTWETVDNFNIDDHLHYHKLPSPGGRDQLHELVASLHEDVMDRERPLWEYHLIGGMKKRRFAAYVKMHHAYADGITLTSWITRSLESKASVKHIRPVWTVAHGERKSQASGEFNLIDAGKKMMGRQRESLQMTRGLAKVVSQLILEKAQLTHNAIALPFSAPNTVLNKPLTPGRQLATASVPMERVQRIRKAARVSLNQVAISCIDEALHRYLSELGQPLEQPLVISMPVSLRRDGRGQQGRGNEVCTVLVELAGETDDPYIRLRDVGVKLRYVRYQVDELPAQAMMGYSMIMIMAALALDSVGAGKFLSPMSNLVISNVPGPRDTLYLNGARLLEHYPVSTIPPENQLNITLYSYDEGLHFGLVATKKLKNLSNLGAYIFEAFEHLEGAVLDPLHEHSDSNSKSGKVP